MHLLALADTALRFSGATLAVLSVLVLSPWGDATGGQAAAAAPTPLGQLRAFRGRVDYQARRLDSQPSEPVFGTLIVTDGGWTSTERHGRFRLEAGPGGGTLRTAQFSAEFDDALTTDELTNAWAIGLGRLASEQLQPTSAPATWATAAGLRVYADPAASRITGLEEPSTSGADIAFVFHDWTQQSGLELPQRIVRLRDGSADATFAISSYSVSRSSMVLKGQAPPAAAESPTQSGTMTAPVMDRSMQMRTARRLWFALIGFMLGGFAIVAWLRRDVLMDRWCRKLAADPRGWKTEGVGGFVTPDGLLFVDGKSYDVGAAFHNRRATVQQSPLFLRISAREVPRAVVVARKFGSPAARRRTAAFSLIDITIATGLFALIVVGAVLPALLAVARAATVARTYATAVRIAQNALNDQEAACEYEPAVGPGSKTTISEGLSVTLDVTAAGSGADDVAVTVRDPGGRTVLSAKTMVGPPVPAPSALAPGGG